MNKEKVDLSKAGDKSKSINNLDRMKAIEKKHKDLIIVKVTNGYAMCTPRMAEILKGELEE
jgi:hypothetical protein